MPCVSSFFSPPTSLLRLLVADGLRRSRSHHVFHDARRTIAEAAPTCKEVDVNRRLGVAACKANWLGLQTRAFVGQRSVRTGAPTGQHSGANRPTLVCKRLANTPLGQHAL